MPGTSGERALASQLAKRVGGWKIRNPASRFALRRDKSEIPSGMCGIPNS
jgi:hypothetical protein